MKASVALILIISIQTFVHASQPITPSIDVVIGIDGGTESIRACCFDAHSGEILGRSCAVPYDTSHPNPGWAEQDPLQWYECMVGAVRGAVASLKNGSSSCSSTYNIKAMCCDTTCCSVVALSEEYTPIRPCLLWMDARSAPQAKRIMDVARASSGPDILESFPELRVNSNGEGPISAEWLLPKAMWIKEMEPENWEKAHVICEYQDYINYRLTKRMVASSCNAAVRWHHDGWEVLDRDGKKEEHAGTPMKLYKALGMTDLANKLPKTTLAMGDVVGGLSKAAAEDLALPEGTLVVQGGPDAFVGMIGLGAIKPNQLCLITGSSHLHCLVTPEPVSKSGMWGAYRGAPLPNSSFAEGGQSSTGRLLVWLRDLVSGDEEDKISYKILDEEASKIDPGSDGLVALETWQGSRTPHTDPLARGAFVGLTLSHTRAHMYRALLEAVCYGTRACFDALETAAQRRASTIAIQKSNEVIIAGGATRSPLWLQLHADISGRTFLINENTDGPLLGCAILASVGCGVHKSVEDAVKNMSRITDIVKPNEKRQKTYDRLYKDVYMKMRPSVTNIFHALADARGGDLSNNDDKRTAPRKRKVTVSPSILAADWSDIKGELEKCIGVGLTHIHVDVFDGVYLDSPHALTFGPQMVRAIVNRFPSLTLDIHLCVDRPARFIDAMAEAGASRLVFQWEAMGVNQLQSAVEFAKLVRESGMKCGVSINPATDVQEIFPLLQTELIDLVDILAVEPGFGGQTFNPIALDKIARLRQWIDTPTRSDNAEIITILVDGGINKGTSKFVIERGADILVAGTSLFRHPEGIKDALKDLNLP